MNSNFDACLRHILRNEGGYVDHIADPGGATNLGITLATLKAWRRTGVTKADVKRLTVTEAGAIYRALYWNKVLGDDLPAGVDLAVFDYAVNSGPGAAAKALQTIIGAPVTGTITAATLKVASKLPPARIVSALCSYRTSFLQRLKTWKVFGRGWTNRVKSVEAAALEMTR